MKLRRKERLRVPYRDVILLQETDNSVQIWCDDGSVLLSHISYGEPLQEWQAKNLIDTYFETRRKIDDIMEEAKANASSDAWNEFPAKEGHDNTDDR